MSFSNILITTLYSLVSISVMLLIIQMVMKRVRQTNSPEIMRNYSYGILFISLFLGAIVICRTTSAMLSDAVNMLYTTSSNPLGNSIKTGCLFIGLSAMWFLIWLPISNILSTIFIGIRKDSLEMEADNISYFLIKGCLFVGMLICIAPVFEGLVNIFMPSIPTPFYH